MARAITGKGLPLISRQSFPTKLPPGQRYQRVTIGNYRYEAEVDPKGNVIGWPGGGVSIETETRALDTLKDATSDVDERSEILKGIKDGKVTFNFLDIENEVVPVIRDNCLKFDELKELAKAAIEKLTPDTAAEPIPAQPVAEQASETDSPPSVYAGLAGLSAAAGVKPLSPAEQKAAHEASPDKTVISDLNKVEHSLASLEAALEQIQETIDNISGKREQIQSIESLAARMNDITEVESQQFEDRIRQARETIEERKNIEPIRSLIMEIEALKSRGADETEIQMLQEILNEVLGPAQEACEAAVRTIQDEKENTLSKRRTWVNQRRQQIEALEREIKRLWAEVGSIPGLITQMADRFESSVERYHRIKDKIESLLPKPGEIPEEVSAPEPAAARAEFAEELAPPSEEAAAVAPEIKNIEESDLNDGEKLAELLDLESLGVPGATQAVERLRKKAGLG